MRRWRALGVLALCAWTGLVPAQPLGDATWQEGEVPAAPAFNEDRLIRFEVTRTLR